MNTRKGNFDVVADEGDTYTGRCHEDTLSGPCEFVSARWPTKTAATARMTQHVDEHDTGKAMPELADSGLRRF